MLGLCRRLLLRWNGRALTAWASSFRGRSSWRRWDIIIIRVFHQVLSTTRDLGWLLQRAPADLVGRVRTDLLLDLVHSVRQESTHKQQSERPTLLTPEPNRFHLIQINHSHLIPLEETTVDKHKTEQQAPSRLALLQMTRATSRVWRRARITIWDISKRTIARGSSSRSTCRSNLYHKEKRCIRHMTRGSRSTSNSWHERRRWLNRNKKECMNERRTRRAQEVFQTTIWRMMERMLRWRVGMCSMGLSDRQRAVDLLIWTCDRNSTKSKLKGLALSSTQESSGWWRIQTNTVKWIRNKNSSCSSRNQSKEAGHQAELCRPKVDVPRILGAKPAKGRSHLEQCQRRSLQRWPLSLIVIVAPNRITQHKQSSNSSKPWEELRAEHSKTSWQLQKMTPKALVPRAAMPLEILREKT